MDNQNSRLFQTLLYSFGLDQPLLRLDRKTHLAISFSNNPQRTYIKSIIAQPCVFARSAVNELGRPHFMQKKALDEMLDPQSRQSMSLGCCC